MPTSSNPQQNSATELEDIFADSDTGQPQPELALPTVAAAPEATSSYEPSVRRRLGKRWFLIIAICVGGLLLLGGLGAMVWYVRSLPPSTTTTNGNTNQPPSNTNLNSNPPVNTNNSTATPPDTFIDVDHDGLSDQEELVANTNPKKKDTDDDGLSDREEVRVYLTDPRNSDTDGDSYVDGVEVANFYHPNDPDPKKRLFDLPN